MKKKSEHRGLPELKSDQGEEDRQSTFQAG